MMRERYAQDVDGAWHPMVDGVDPGFKPVAVVTVKAKAVSADPAPDPVPAGAPPVIIAMDPGAEAAAIVAVRREGPGHAMVFVGGEAQPIPARKVKRSAPAPKPVPPAFRPAMAKHDRMIAAKRAGEEMKHTATPGDVIRAIGEQFGILAATGANVSSARFKPMARRNEDEDAARAYAGAVEKNTGQK
jgi:hypothetical protein